MTIKILQDLEKNKIEKDKKCLYRNHANKNLVKKVRLDVALRKHRSYIFIIHTDEVSIWH